MLAGGSQDDIRDLRRDLQEQGLVFGAHTQLHRFPCAVPDTTSNRSISAAIKRQPSTSQKRVDPSSEDLFGQTGSAGWAGLMAARSLLSNSTASLGPWTGTYGLSGLDGISDRDTTTLFAPCRAPRPQPLSKATEASGERGDVNARVLGLALCRSTVGKGDRTLDGGAAMRRRTQDFFDASASRRVVNITAHRKALLAIRFP